MPTKCPHHCAPTRLWCAHRQIQPAHLVCGSFCLSWSKMGAGCMGRLRAPNAMQWSYLDIFLALKPVELFYLRESLRTFALNDRW